MEQPRCHKYFTMLKYFFTNLWIPTTCLLHPQRSWGMQLRVQAVTGFFLEGGTPRSSVKQGVFKYSLSRTTTAIPGSDLTATKISSPSQAHSWGTDSLTGFLAHCLIRWPLIALLSCFLHLSPLLSPLLSSPLLFSLPLFSPYTFLPRNRIYPNFNALKHLLFKVGILWLLVFFSINFLKIK